MENYFGGVEAVWQEKMSFIQSLFITTELLNNNLRHPEDINKKDGEYKPMDLEQFWFAPCSFFRTTGDVYNYFQKYKK